MLGCLLVLSACSVPQKISVLPSTVRQATAPAADPSLMRPEQPEKYSESAQQHMEGWQKKLADSQPK